MGGRRGGAENDGVLAAGKKHALLLVAFGFGQAEDIDVEKMQLLECLQGGRELPDAAVDEDKVGELLLLLLHAGIVAGNDFLDAGEIIGALNGSDPEPAVIGLL